MKHTIEGFSQEYATTLKKKVKIKQRGEEKEKEIKIDCTDLVILRWFVDFFPNMKKMIIDGKEYAWLTHKKMLNDLPLLDISKRACIDRMQKLVEFGILEYKLIKDGGTFSLYSFGKNYINLVGSNEQGVRSNDIGGVRSNDIGGDVQPDNKDKSIIDKSINNNKEINKESEIDINFENLWKLLKAHPNDRKSKVTKKRKKELYEMGYERVEKAINLYLKIQNPEYYHKRDNILNEIIDNYIDKTEKDFNVEVEEHTASYDISEYEKQTESIPTNTNNQVDTNSKEISDYDWYEMDMKPGEDDYLSKKLAELRKKPEKAIGF